LGRKNIADVKVPFGAGLTLYKFKGQVILQQLWVHQRCTQSG